MSAVITPYRACNRCEDFNVGYAQSDLQKNGLTAGACFVPVQAGEKVDLVDLVVKGYTGICEGGVQIQELNDWGHTVAIYYWMDDGTGAADGWCGWYLEGATDPIEGKVQRGSVVIQAGEGLWTSSSAAGYTIQSSGQVPTTEDVIVTLQKNGLSVANPTPVNVDLVDTFITGYTGQCEGGVQIQELNDWGHTVAIYYWMDDGTNDPNGWYGWYKEGAVDPIEGKVKSGAVVIKPGTGLWTSSNSDGYYFTWPKVEIQ